jgi:prepilin-type N-terminal cleavage/methylation domain-containing protein
MTHKNLSSPTSGFTLVELAIVLMIIGLLIGGILKGQELITNARITSAGAQIQGYEAAVITFQDSYGALPGDITNPSTRIPNCTASGCNIAGDGNGRIGQTDGWGVSAENNNFWVHMAKANLISGIDGNADWNAGTYFLVPPKFKIGGQMGMIYFGTNAFGVAGITAGHHWHSFGPAARYQDIARYDRKFDDGKATTGTVLLHTNGTPAADGSYDMTQNTMSDMWIHSTF